MIDGRSDRCELGEARDVINSCLLSGKMKPGAVETGSSRGRNFEMKARGA
jgi:hypothetical protein